MSLRAMAARTHRDPATLSRFERGASKPADRDWLVSQYRLLAIPAPAAVETVQHETPQPQQSQGELIAFVGWYAGRWIVLALALLTTTGAFNADPLMAEELRMFAIVSALGLLYVGARFHEGPRTQYLLMFARTLIPVCLVIAHWLSDLNQPTINLTLLAFTVVWVELGYWYWGYERFIRRESVAAPAPPRSARTRAQAPAA